MNVQGNIFPGAPVMSGTVAIQPNVGIPGKTPHIGENGNWFIGETDTGNPSRGENGEPGKPGADGYSPTVTVDDIEGGHRVTITDKDGDKVFDVMDGKDSESAVSYNEQTLTPEQQAQARKNIGAAKEQIPLSANQINALDALFCLMAYTEDARSAYTQFREAFGIEEQGNDPDNKFEFLLHKRLDKLADKSAAIKDGTNRILTYSKSDSHDRRFAIHNGDYWDVSDYKPIRIPVGAVSVRIIVPESMRYGCFIYDEHSDPRFVIVSVDSGWITDGSVFDVSAYNDGNYYFGANLSYTSNAEIPDNFDISALDAYFVDGNGKRM